MSDNAEGAASAVEMQYEQGGQFEEFDHHDHEGDHKASSFLGNEDHHDVDAEHSDGSKEQNHEGEEGDHEGAPALADSNAAAPEGQAPKEARGKDRGDRRGKRAVNVQKVPANWEPKKGCCPSCLKAFSVSKRSCRCQVPFSRLTEPLPPSGCKELVVI
jgi:hypothetical protein